MKIDASLGAHLKSKRPPQLRILGSVAAEAQDLRRLVVPPHRLGHDQSPERKGCVHPHGADLGLHVAMVHGHWTLRYTLSMNEREHALGFYDRMEVPRRTSEKLVDAFLDTWGTFNVTPRE